MKKVFGFLFLFLLVIILSGCSQKDRLRLGETIELELPSEVLVVGDVPQIVTVSTESDGDILITYVNRSNEIVTQQYGCPVVSVSCTNLNEQGYIIWRLPTVMNVQN